MRCGARRWFQPRDEESCAPFFRSWAITAAAAACVVTATPAADADPAPGFQFDPAALQARMDDCLEYAVDDSFELMGWVNVSTGESRH